MNTLEINQTAGTLLLNGVVIAPLKIQDFLSNVALARVHPSTKNPSAAFVTYCLDGQISGNLFGVNVTYEDGKLESVWLSWAGGITAVKGYEASETELIKDKNRLTKLLSKYLGKLPDEVGYQHDMFQYVWGYLSVACSVRAALISVGLNWVDLERV